jgi:hypothetical protein
VTIPATSVVLAPLAPRSLGGRASGLLGSATWFAVGRPVCSSAAPRWPSSCASRGSRAGATFPVVVRGGLHETRCCDDGQTVPRAPASVGVCRGTSSRSNVVRRTRGSRSIACWACARHGRGLVWVTQADNEPAPDPAFARHRLLGVVEVPVSSVATGVRALGRFLPALLAPFTVRVARPARGARRQAVPVSRSASR